MKVLILGGTADGRKMAAALTELGVPVIYSVAGLVRRPALDCEILVGGFSALGGLSAFCQARNVQLILDITHPFAAQMSNTAVQAANGLDIPCWRFHRLDWPKHQDDDWHEFRDWAALLIQAQCYQRVFVSAGRISQEDLNSLSRACQLVVLRTAVKPDLELADNVVWIHAIGPFTLSDERDLFQQYQIDCLISKNSGGAATYAKLVAAREAKMPVLMHQRPVLAKANQQFTEPAACIYAVQAWLSEHLSTPSSKQEASDA
ncbi:precorrin-6A/cobalt-precorrin-6A reductase [Motilimonas cestriensis]|uniref:precorrin-6A/cobalt-precorrin-6A reductase n=1 Tax=Motilimonas cestriensis TaxID=2742685 RepID=UPI003DA68B1F